MLIVLPLGLLAAAVVFDILYLITDEDAFATVAFWNIAAGILGGLLAAVFGLWDWLHVPSDTRAKRIGLFHGGDWVRFTGTPRRVSEHHFTGGLHAGGAPRRTSCAPPPT